MKYRPEIPSLRPTDEKIFFNRRHFIQSLGLGSISAVSASCSSAAAEKQELLQEPLSRPEVFPPTVNASYTLPRGLETSLTPRREAASHNNFYEFLPGRGGPVWKHVEKFQVEPWKVEISGACRNPRTLGLDDLFGISHEERLYHFRCVERWAMNVPWSGFPLRKLIEDSDPKPEAKFVRFVTAYRPSQMPGIRQASNYPWPYHEALRIDEAMNELAMVVTGVYGKPLLKQHGAPVRIIVPWKYGYKNPKSVVKIEFVRKEPKIFWQILPHEYGFLSNVNPFIPHPRWSQQRSYWLDSESWFPTPIFNGYDKYVADLYPDEPRAPQTRLRRGQTAR